MSSFERATLRWAKIAVLMSALAALFVCAQWYEMHSGATDTHTLAQAADKQAGKMTDMSNAADKIRQAAEGMVGQERRIADEADESLKKNLAQGKLALEATNRQSKAALEATIAQNRLDQRPWVGVGDFSVTAFDEHKFGIQINIVNSGKTPAIKLRTASRTKIYSYLADGPYPTDVSAFEFVPATSIPPQGKYIFRIDFNGGNNPVISHYAIIKDRLSYLFQFGEFQYEDVSGRIHTTQFCLYMSDPDTRQMAFCNRFNDMD